MCRPQSRCTCPCCNGGCCLRVHRNNLLFDIWEEWQEDAPRWSIELKDSSQPDLKEDK